MSKWLLFVQEEDNDGQIVWERPQETIWWNWHIKDCQATESKFIHHRFTAKTLPKGLSSLVWTIHDLTRLTQKAKKRKLFAWWVWLRPWWFGIGPCRWTIWLSSFSIYPEAPTRLFTLKQKTSRELLRRSPFVFELGTAWQSQRCFWYVWYQQKHSWCNLFGAYWRILRRSSRFCWKRIVSVKSEYLWKEQHSCNSCLKWWNSWWDDDLRFK